MGKRSKKHLKIFFFNSYPLCPTEELPPFIDPPNNDKKKNL